MNGGANKEVDINAPGNPTNTNQELIQIGKVTYHDSLIGIFIDSSEKNPRRFFFEPAVLLVPNRISCQTNELFKQDVVRCSIKMWDSELRSKVLQRVQSMPNFKNLKIHKEDIYVMPYQEVQLVLKPGSSMDQSVQFMEDQQLLPFHPRFNKMLDFYFICDSSSTATTLVENFKKYPGFVLRKWKLALEFRGLVLENDAGEPSKSPVVTINVSTLPDKLLKTDDDGNSNDSDSDSVIEVPNEPESEAHLLPGLIENYKQRNQDLTNWMRNIPDWMDGAVIIFTAEKCLNPKSPLPKGPSKKGPSPSLFPYPGQLGFSQFEISLDKKHGDFHLPTGTFTVKTSGLYMLHLSGYYDTITDDGRSNGACVELKIDSFPYAIAKSIESDAVRNSNLIEYPPVVVTALLPLKAGDKINAFVHSARLHEYPPHYTTRFAATLFSDESSMELSRQQHLID